MQRIYFVGSHSTGKTTLARWTAKEYGLPIIGEVARSVLSELEVTLDDLRTDLAATDDFQRRVFERQARAEDAAGDSFVSDRAFDCVAYAAEHANVAGEIFWSDAMRDYLQRVRAGRVFFVRPCPETIADDGVRAGLAWDDVVRLDGMIKMLLELFQIPYMPIRTPSMQERVRIVTAVLGESDAG